MKPFFVTRLICSALCLFFVNEEGWAADLTRSEIEGLLASATQSKPADLRRKDLRGLDLSRLDLRHADLWGADLGAAFSCMLVCSG